MSTGMSNSPRPHAPSSGRARLARRRSRCCTVCRRIRCRAEARTCAPFSRSTSALGLPTGLSDHGRRRIRGAAGGRSRRHALRASPHARCRQTARSTPSVSSTPSELADLDPRRERARAALGSGEKTCLAAERPNRVASRRSLCAARHLGAGTILGADDLIALRPGIGLTPERQLDLVGMRLLRDIEPPARRLSKPTSNG